MNQEILRECLVENIRDIFDAEKQLTKALPKMAKAASSEELSEAIQNHLEETQNQVQRLEQVFQTLGIAAKGKPCKGMKGLLEEGTEAIEENDEGELRDLAIISAAQRVEHYEISAYGTARALAEQLGESDIVELLQETLDEEENADEKLTECAMAIYEAEDEDEGEEMDSEEEEEETVAASSRRPAASAGGARKAATKKAAARK